MQLQAQHINAPSPSYFLSKYDTAGPRYTSYPTANQLTSDIGASEYLTLAEQESDSIAPLSLYIHVPFCDDICYYCGCNKVVTRKPNTGRQFLDQISIELEQRGKLHPHRPVIQLHWGGGTPTFLDHGELTELMHLIARHFKLEDNPSREYSIEIDPRTVTTDTIALLKGLGFNRISMGIQDFDSRVQTAINRVQSFAEVESLTAAIRQYGFKSLNFDLIYGLPFQSVDSYQKTLQQVIALNPDRISCYNYAHLPDRFSSQRAIDRLALPSAEEKLALFESIIERLTAARYEYIGMDHFVKAGDELAIAREQGRLQRNFQGYSTSMAPDLIGIGPSAISQFRDHYFQNEKEVDQYYTALNQGELPISKGLAATTEDQLRSYVIMQLACQLRVDFTEVKHRFDIDFTSYFASNIERLLPFIQDGLVSLDNHAIQIHQQGRLVLRNICMQFDEYLTKGEIPLFSRTI